jgi:flavin-binding protein dodecin
MAGEVYKLVELTGSSDKSISDAIDVAISRAGSTLRRLGWFEVTQVRGQIANGKVGRYQVTLKVGFTLDSGEQA